MCWSSISNGRCKELLSQRVTKENCCASNAAAATAYSEEDLDSEKLFFWGVLGGGVQCRPCRESCAEVRCEEGKKCVVRRGRPRCVCSPECKAPRGGGPVCGTDGKSYKNLCRLKKRACKKGSHELAVAYKGHCQSSCVRVRCGQGRSCLLDQNLSPHCVKCARRCPQPPPQQRAAARPVCGADGNTYKSACHLRLAACRAGRAIPVAYKGHCKLFQLSGAQPTPPRVNPDRVNRLRNRKYRATKGVELLIPGIVFWWAGSNAHRGTKSGGGFELVVVSKDRHGEGAKGEREYGKFGDRNTIIVSMLFLLCLRIFLCLFRKLSSLSPRVLGYAIFRFVFHSGTFPKTLHCLCDTRLRN
ncbi:follistatin-related protein 3 isoform X4 [Ptiloglossa arizonensis]